MTTVINPTYTGLRQWIEQLPETFSESGDVIYDARNQVRVITGPDGQLYNVKRFRQPFWFNRIVYSWIRKPKAVRAYENASLLHQMGIPTPGAVAYICLKSRWGLLQQSYLITEQSTLPGKLYDLGTQSPEGKEELVRAFARMTAEMHEKGVLHKDFSPGNILYGKEGERWVFTLVDINRMRFGNVSRTDGCREFARLWGKRIVFEWIADEYAHSRGWDADDCLQRILKERKRFWKRRHPHPDQYTPDEK